jgi:CRP-like cAMP-binding protein
VGIILTGNVHIIQEDYWGNRSILTHIAPPDLFGEAFACAEMEKTPVSALAVEKTDVLFIDYQKIITICPSACVFHGQLIENMLRILAEKNILLTQKMEILSKRTTKEKLLAYLSFQAIAAKSSSFYIPFQRQALADYLGVDRSAMSSALGALKKEGKIDFEKNWFRLF